MMQTHVMILLYQFTGAHYGVASAEIWPHQDYHGVVRPDILVGHDFIGDRVGDQTRTRAALAAIKYLPESQ
jgi:hypothetical protein